MEGRAAKKDSGQGIGRPRRRKPFTSMDAVTALLTRALLVRSAISPPRSRLAASTVARWMLQVSPVGGGGCKREADGCGLAPAVA